MPDLAILVPLIAVIIVVGILSALPKPAKRRRKTQQAIDPAPVAPAPRRDPVEAIGKVRWTVSPIMNGSEYRIFSQLEALAHESRDGVRVFSQVSVGEILSVDFKSSERGICQSAKNAVNSKRVDFLITDLGSMPIAVVEYHGAGHFQGNANARDSVKREAFRMAGIPLIEVSKDGFAPAQLADIRRLMGLPVSLAVV